MKFQFIAAEQAHHSLSLLCRCLGVTRSGFHAWQGRPASPRATRDARLKVLVRASFTRSRRTYGSPRVYRDLREQGEAVSRKRVVRLMREDGLQPRRRKRFVCTTNSAHDHPVAANLLARRFTADAPNQRWVSDTTEFVLDEGPKVYLAIVLDLFSRFVVGWAISPVNDRSLTQQALERALQRRQPAAGLLHHSDRGSTYASGDYQTVLATHGITCSMSRTGNCYDNAVAEAFFSTLKTELADRFATLTDATRQVFNYIDVFYNHQRRHSTIGYMSPAACERAFARAAADNGVALGGIPKPMSALMGTPPSARRRAPSVDNMEVP